MNKIISDISDYIFVSDEPEKVDAIFLPGGAHPELPEYAAELYHKGYAKWLVPSGGVSVKRDKWPGVRSDAIIGEDKSGHTRDNAFLLRKVIDEKGIQIKTALVVCKAFHARRCLMLYQMVFPNVKIKVCPVPWDANFTHNRYFIYYNCCLGYPCLTKRVFCAIIKPTKSFEVKRRKNGLLFWLAPYFSLRWR